MVLFDFESGHAFVGHMSLALRLTDISGEIHLNHPDGPILRPVSVSERLRLVQFALTFKAKNRENSKTVLAAAMLQQATALKTKTNRQAGSDIQTNTVNKHAYQAVALHLAGAGNQAPGLYESIRLVAKHTGWLPDALLNSDASQIDHIAASLSPPASASWTRLLIVDAVENEPAFLCDRLAQDLLERADSQCDVNTHSEPSMASTPTHSVPLHNSDTPQNNHNAEAGHRLDINPLSKNASTKNTAHQPQVEQNSEVIEPPNTESLVINKLPAQDLCSTDDTPPKMHPAFNQANHVSDIKPLPNTNTMPLKRSIKDGTHQQNKKPSGKTGNKDNASNHAVAEKTAFEHTAPDNVLLLSRHRALNKIHHNNGIKASSATLENMMSRDAPENAWQINPAPEMAEPGLGNSQTENPIDITKPTNNAHTSNVHTNNAHTNNHQKTRCDITDFFKQEESSLADKLAIELNREADLRGIN